MTSKNPQTRPAKQVPQLTFLEHIEELRTRLFWAVGSILVISSLGYLIKDQLINVLLHPLGQQQLYYLTPVGGFSFLIKICFYFGVLVSIPLIIYHFYRYLQPLMDTKTRSIKTYIFFSTLLAAAGVGFAYFISLPAALHFLTDFNINQITAMLTVDSYLTFVLSYLLGAALLFQIPLVLLIINGITPLKPKGLMGYQRHVILGAFIIAAVISPTPDIANQALLALPIIVMYQVGIVLVWLRNRKQRNPRKPAAPTVSFATPAQPLTVPDFEDTAPAVAQSSSQTETVNPGKAAAKPASQLISDFGARPVKRLAPERQVRLVRTQPLASIDGIIARS